MDEQKEEQSSIRDLGLEHETKVAFWGNRVSWILTFPLILLIIVCCPKSMDTLIFSYGMVSAGGELSRHLKLSERLREHLIVIGCASLWIIWFLAYVLAPESVFRTMAYIGLGLFLINFAGSWLRLLKHPGGEPKPQD